MRGQREGTRGKLNKAVKREGRQKSAAISREVGQREDFFFLESERLDLAKESTCNAGDAGDTSLIPGLGRSPGDRHGTNSSVLAWRIPWTEEPGGL